jgi:hypothetical protein
MTDTQKFTKVRVWGYSWDHGNGCGFAVFGTREKRDHSLRECMLSFDDDGAFAHITDIEELYAAMEPTEVFDGRFWWDDHEIEVAVAMKPIGSPDRSA